MGRWSAGRAARNTIAALTMAAASAFPAAAQQAPDEPYHCEESGRWAADADACYTVDGVRLADDVVIREVLVTQDRDDDRMGPEMVGELRIPARSYRSLEDVQIDLFAVDQDVTVDAYTHQAPENVPRGNLTFRVADGQAMRLSPALARAGDVGFRQVSANTYLLDATQWRMHADRVAPGQNGACLEFQVYDRDHPEAAIGGTMRVLTPIQPVSDKEAPSPQRTPFSCEAPPTTIPTPAPAPEPVPVVAPPPTPAPAPEEDRFFPAFGVGYKEHSLEAWRTDHVTCPVGKGLAGIADLAYVADGGNVHANVVIAPFADGCNAADEEFPVHRLEARLSGSTARPGVDFGGALDAYTVRAEDSHDTEMTVLHAEGLVGNSFGNTFVGAGPLVLYHGNEQGSQTAFGLGAAAEHVSEQLRLNLSGYAAPSPTDHLNAGGRVDATWLPLEIGGVRLGLTGGVRADYLCFEDAVDEHQQGYIGIAVQP